MIETLRRYARAFALALRYTLRGEKPPLLKVRERYPELAGWWEQTIRLVEAVERSASESQVDPAALVVHVDRRDISMETILKTIRFHAEREYPYLVAHEGDEYRQVTLQAMNVNDRYLITQLVERVDSPVKSAVDALRAHLENLPSIDR